MVRKLLGLIGLVMVVAPRRIVEYAESLAFENPDDATLRGWTIPMARLEGLAYLLVARRVGRPSRGVAVLLALVAAVAGLAPRRYLDFGLSLSYENPEDIDVKGWVVPTTRLLGLAVAVATLGVVRGGKKQSSRSEQRTEA